MATEKKIATEEKPTEEKIEVQNGLKTKEVKVADVVVQIKNISLKLPENIHRKLKAKCAMEGESTGNVLKRLIDDYIKRN
jgi:hypothetical protein